MTEIGKWNVRPAPAALGRVDLSRRDRRLSGNRSPRTHPARFGQTCRSQWRMWTVASVIPRGFPIFPVVRFGSQAAPNLRERPTAVLYGRGGARARICFFHRLRLHSRSILPARAPSSASFAHRRSTQPARHPFSARHYCVASDSNHQPAVRHHHRVFPERINPVGPHPGTASPRRALLRRPRSRLRHQSWGCEGVWACKVPPSIMLMADKVIE